MIPFMCGHTPCYKYSKLCWQPQYSNMLICTWFVLCMRWQTSQCNLTCQTANKILMSSFGTPMKVAAFSRRFNLGSISCENKYGRHAVKRSGCTPKHFQKERYIIALSQDQIYQEISKLSIPSLPLHHCMQCRVTRDQSTRRWTLLQSKLNRFYIWQNTKLHAHVLKYKMLIPGVGFQGRQRLFLYMGLHEFFVVINGSQWYFRRLSTNNKSMFAPYPSME